MVDPNTGVDFPAVPTHGGKFILYNIFGNLFEVSAKYGPPIKPIGRGAYGIVCSLLNTKTDEMVAAVKKIPSFEEALAHPYLAERHDAAYEPVCPEPFNFDFEQNPLDEEQIKKYDIREEALLAFNPVYA
ncbi:hypothetical protein K1719_041864 [Acacia pycnantha]|nr:hypothetical protein K1719_041864 [Acacia pycnantha]